MDAKHTPGPWRLNSDALIVGNGDMNTSIAIAYDKSSAADGVSRDEMRANARLIAAAPRMVKALQWAAKVLAELPMAEQGPLMLSLRSEIVATIQEAAPEYYGAKAKGE